MTDTMAKQIINPSSGMKDSEGFTKIKIEANKPGNSPTKINGDTSTQMATNQTNSNRLPIFNNQNSFIRSITAPRTSIPYVTIEPVLFLAVFALFVELPAVQDLLYSRICLQNFANSHVIIVPSQPGKAAKLINTITMPSLENNASLNGNKTNQLESLVQLNGTITETWPRITVCDKRDRTKLPLDMRSKIETEQQSFWLLYQLTIGILCAITAPFWGGISDRVGRLMPLNLAILCAFIAHCSYLLVGILISIDKHDLLPLNFLYVPAILIGLSGGQAVVIVNSFGFISDITSNESRSKRILILEIMQNTGHISGWLISYKFFMTLPITRLLLEEKRTWNNRYLNAFSFAASLNAIAIIYSMISLRHHKFHRFLNNFEREQQEAASNGQLSVVQSKKNHQMNIATSSKINDTIGGPRKTVKNNSSSFSGLETCIDTLEPERNNGKSIWTLEHYRQTYITLTKPREFRSIISLLLFCGFISYTCLALILSLLFLYITSSPFNLNTSDYSYWNLKTHLIQGTSLICLSICMKLVPKWDVPDPLVASLGFLSKAIGLMTLGCTRSTTVIQWSFILFIFAEFTMPPIRSLLSKLVVKDEIGKVYSCLSMLSGICIVSSNIIFYVAWNLLRQENYYRISFIGVACLQFGCFILMLYIYSQLRNRAFTL